MEEEVVIEVDVEDMKETGKVGVIIGEVEIEVAGRTEEKINGVVDTEDVVEEVEA